MDDDAIRRCDVDDYENARFEDDHIEPYVNLRRISADPAIRQVTFPPHATLGVHSHPCDTLYLIQSGEFIVDGEGVVPARRAALGARPACRTVPERSGPDGAVRADRVDERPVRRALGARSRLMVLVAADLASRAPDEVALRDDDVALGWAEVNDILNRVVNGLGRLDLGPDRRVAVFAENSVETVLAHLGGLLAGASTVPVNFHLNADEVAYILEDSGAQVLFVGPETAATGLEAAAAGRRAGRHRLARASDAGTSRLVGGLAGGGVAGEPPPTCEPRPNLMYTSGTTGRPEGVELPPTMFAGGATMTEHVAALAKSPFAALRHPPRRRPDVPHGPLSGVRLLAAGIPVVVLGRFDAENVLRAIDTHRIETHRDGADPLRPPAGAARRRAVKYDVQLVAARRPHRRRRARSTSSTR